MKNKSENKKRTPETSHFFFSEKSSTTLKNFAQSQTSDGLLCQTALRQQHREKQKDVLQEAQTYWKEGVCFKFVAVHHCTKTKQYSFMKKITTKKLWRHTHRGEYIQKKTVNERQRKRESLKKVRVLIGPDV